MEVAKGTQTALVHGISAQRIKHGSPAAINPRGYDERNMGKRGTHAISAGRTCRSPASPAWTVSYDMQSSIYRHPALPKWSATSEQRIRYTYHPIPQKSNMVKRQKSAHHHMTHGYAAEGSTPPYTSSTNNATYRGSAPCDSHSPMSRSHHNTAPEEVYIRKASRPPQTLPPHRKIYTLSCLHT